jgi:hypothetical protein
MSFGYNHYSFQGLDGHIPVMSAAGAGNDSGCDYCLLLLV